MGSHGSNSVVEYSFKIRLCVGMLSRKNVPHLQKYQFFTTTLIMLKIALQLQFFLKAQNQIPTLPVGNSNYVENMDSSSSEDVHYEEITENSNVNYLRSPDQKL